MCTALYVVLCTHCFWSVYIAIPKVNMTRKCHICGSVIASLDDITNFEILPYLLHFSEVLKRMKVINDFVGQCM